MKIYFTVSGSDADQLIQSKMKEVANYGVAQTVIIRRKVVTTCMNILKLNTLGRMDTIVSYVTKLVLPEMLLEFITFATTKINKINHSYCSALDEVIKSKSWKDSDGMMRCAECDYSSQYQTNLRKHIEAHHMKDFLAEYKCPVCFKSFSSKNSLQSHKSRFQHHLSSVL